MRAHLPFALLLAGLLGGCAGGGGDVFAVVPVVGGEKLRVPLSQQIPSARTAEVEVAGVRFEPHPQKDALALRCELKRLKPITLSRITVEDVAGEQPVLLIDDRAPHLEGNVWKSAAGPLGKDDAKIAWLVSLENTIRVYRFTVETAEGRKIVLHQPAFFPGFLKEQMRQTLGLNY